MLKGFKTVLFNTIMTGAMVGRLWEADIEVDAEQLAGHLDAIALGIAFLWGLGNTFLRAVTDSPIFNRKKAPDGAVNAMVLLILPLLLMACAGQSYTAQVRDQGGTTAEIAVAAYADALKWYNDHQEAFVVHVRELPAEAKADPGVADRLSSIDGMFDLAGEVLDKWRLATTLAGMQTQEAEWRRARDALIDAGLMLLVKD